MFWAFLFVFFLFFNLLCLLVVIGSLALSLSDMDANLSDTDSLMARIQQLEHGNVYSFTIFNIALVLCLVLFCIFFF